MSTNFIGNVTIVGDDVDIIDTAGGITFDLFESGATGTSTVVANGAGADVDITIDDLMNGGFGVLEITAPDDITIAGDTWMTSGDELVANSTGGGDIIVDNINMTGTIDLTGITGTATGGSGGVFLGTNGGSYTITNVTTDDINITTNNANITIGTAGNENTVNDFTFNAGNADVIGYSNFTGNIAGSAGRIGIEDTAGDLAVNGITATGSTGYYGAADETLILETHSGDITGSGITTSGAGNMRLMAGAFDQINTGNQINVTNVSAAQDASFFSTYSGAGDAISVTGTSNVAGNIIASGVNASNQYAAVDGNVDISLSSGDLTTAMVWTDSGRNIDLTATNGSILQDSAAYPFTFNGKTIFALGDVTLTSGGATGIVNTGVRNPGAGNDLTIRAGGVSGGTSVQLWGRVDGNLLVERTAGTAVTGDVYLGNTLGASEDDLADTFQIVDVLGSTTVRSTEDVNLYGSFQGGVNLTGNTVDINTDKGNFSVNSIVTTATTGTAVDIDLRRGAMTGGNITTAGSSHVILATGNVAGRDKISYIDLTNVSTGGNLTASVLGSTNGGASGSSISITGSTGGSTTVNDGQGGSPIGSVSTP